MENEVLEPEVLETEGMETNEGLVTEQLTENVEQPTEESPKLYTQADFDQKVKETVDKSLGKKIARREAKLRKEYDGKYGDLMGVLKAGTGIEDVGELTESFRQHYTQQGRQMPQQPSYGQRETEILAKADAQDIIDAGFEDVVEEVDRLASIGLANMTPREKAEFAILARYRQDTERGQELARIGVTEEEYKSKAFTDFAAKFDSKTPISEVYQLYQGTKPRKQIQTMGSMKQGQGKTVKDFYTEAEIEKLSMEDLDDPKVWEAVRRSMTGR